MLSSTRFIWITFATIQLSTQQTKDHLLAWLSKRILIRRVLNLT